MTKLFITEVSATETSRGYWVGETSAICISTNVEELKGTPVEFYGDDMFSVIRQVQSALRAKGLPAGVQIC